MSDRPTPGSPLALPTSRARLVERAVELVTQCRTSAGMRTSRYREINAVVNSGRTDGVRALINMLNFHIDRTASHIFSPSYMHFTMDTDWEYPEETLLKLHQAAKILTRNWQKNNTDILFGQAVRPALEYGCCLMKQFVERTENDGAPNYGRALVMPWQFGVYNESVEELSRQPAFVETSMLTLPEIWKRISVIDDMTDGEKHDLLTRVKSRGTTNNATTDAYGFFHQVLSTSQIQTGLNAMMNPIPGGIVNLNNSGTGYVGQSPDIGVDTYPFHELWVWGEKDYVTIQYVEPDILLAPRNKKENLLAPDLQPYTIIRPNPEVNNFWGKSEVDDLVELQQWLATSADDAKRLLGLQVDKILAFIGDEGMTDEKYAQARAAGYFNMGQGSDIKDYTPEFPATLLPMIEKIEALIDKIGGFGNVLDGQGTPGVRSGNHNEQLVRTASPTLRDRSLLLERQCAEAGDLTYNIMRAKDARSYWIAAEKSEETKFTLASLPDDAMAVVDSHSTSPIFSDDHQQLIFAGAKLGWLDGQSGIELLPFPQKELLHKRLQNAQAAKQKQLEELKKTDPEGYVKVISGHHK